MSKSGVSFIVDEDLEGVLFVDNLNILLNYLYPNFKAYLQVKTDAFLQWNLAFTLFIA